MNNKLPRLVLVGLGTMAVAVLSVFSSKAMPVSDQIGTGDEIAQTVPVRLPNPPASAVRG